MTSSTTAIVYDIASSSVHMLDNISPFIYFCISVMFTVLIFGIISAGFSNFVKSLRR